ncbi:hypothetical protein FRC16_004712 [Serendipita sp. 398]|nr:hypothetical protein FRC16_004712 [Serendipita sp. 398]
MFAIYGYLNRYVYAEYRNLRFRQSMQLGSHALVKGVGHSSRWRASSREPCQGTWNQFDTQED